jgi:hypothetical protein
MRSSKDQVGALGAAGELVVTFAAFFQADPARGGGLGGIWPQSSAQGQTPVLRSTTPSRKAKGNASEYI